MASGPNSMARRTASASSRVNSNSLPWAMSLRRSMGVMAPWPSARKGAFIRSPIAERRIFNPGLSVSSVNAVESVAKSHPRYWEAKEGGEDAAVALVGDLMSEEHAQVLQQFGVYAPLLVSAHAYEREGVNAIPEILATVLGDRLGWHVDGGVVQVNVVSHTGADGFGRLARQAAFGGLVHSGRNYVLVDDFVGMGGTLANLRGYIEAKGGRVLAATVLTGKPRSARLCISEATLQELRCKHGEELEKWWYLRFGHSFDALTESEARYCIRTPDVVTIRDRIVAAEQAGDRPVRG